ncbi:DNA replication and repair protein RadC [Sulfobacillus thermosulfidooxidans DSM 9293]|uniref:DNA replication and repair protein RadC n=1 Tax=Sulfobacillus thermosulfidooxidans (strain DSM 9293 / VKM B-1269 / AT-1) TaxID=929705 RepID=A0A1W1W8M0_SULTA|nr:DNA repair protein RadC [Sulfobacillus thermosulfidooxidans]SMC02626.1 DNA replication and repair protein RadC [Sulfobacillus thermosulfidooxidans DSM 9293]
MSRVQDLPSEERPRERLMRHGAKVLGDRELLAVLLGTGTSGQSVLELSGSLLQDGWQALSRRQAQELLQIKGLGQAKVALLLAALEIGNRVRRQEMGNRITGPEDVVILMEDMIRLSQEEFRVLFLNTKNQVLAIETIFRGGLDSVEVFPREIFKRAVGWACASIIVVHNHPSGDPSPSRADRSLTKRLEDAGDLLGIPVLDHVIMGRARHVSVHQGQLTELTN